MSKKENRFIMHYDYESRKRVFRLNGRDVTVEIERLLEAHEKEIVSTKCKLFQLDMTIQQRLQNQLALTEKALELAVEELDDAKDMLRECGKKEWAGLLNTSVDYFKAKSKEIVDNDTSI